MKFRASIDNKSTYPNMFVYLCFQNSCSNMLLPRSHKDKNFSGHQLLLRHGSWASELSQFTQNVLFHAFHCDLLGTLKKMILRQHRLCVRAHNFVLPPKDNRNFLASLLYNAMCPPMCDY